MTMLRIKKYISKVKAADKATDSGSERTLRATKPLAVEFVEDEATYNPMRRMTHDHGRHALAGPGIWKMDAIRTAMFEGCQVTVQEVVGNFYISLNRGEPKHGNELTVTLLRTVKQNHEAGAVADVQMRILTVKQIQSPFKMVKGCNAQLWHV